MANKQCFLSFHYKPDNWRVQQVKNIGSIDEQPILTANKWEEIKKEGDTAVESWIDRNMNNKECLIVLVGTKTAGRRWVKYEIKKAWEKGLGVMAIHIHNLKDAAGEQSEKGSNPFAGLKVDGHDVVGTVYDPPYKTSTFVYEHITENIEDWVKAAIKARK
ncbi:TIR domain-containing protein [Roseomonas aerophila]|uniref:TIR domain-containing protein n=1 Tax=Teichococcus aerophilus TaxID=1224513 RepID=A0ABR7RV24_9PROT|nr:TIR domain-containing protein [Pseudoroseomonas aerophila]MBC9209827.1 TIR domain-containing protein [Pseudoroseomonas aerophila]